MKKISHCERQDERRDPCSVAVCSQVRCSYLSSPLTGPCGFTRSSKAEQSRSGSTCECFDKSHQRQAARSSSIEHVTPPTLSDRHVVFRNNSSGAPSREKRRRLNRGPLQCAARPTFATPALLSCRNPIAIRFLAAVLDFSISTKRR